MLLETKYFSIGITTSLKDKMPNLFIKLYKLELTVLNVYTKNKRLFLTLGIGLSK